MANVCYHCGKGVLYGRSHTHHRGVAGGRWKKRAPKTRRIFQPNLQRVDILEKGMIKRVKICAKCIKRVKKDINDKKKPFLQIVKFLAKEDYKKKEEEKKELKEKVKETKKKREERKKPKKHQKKSS